MPKVPFHVPALGPGAIKGVTEVIKSGWLTTGEVTKEFENKVALLCNAKHAIAVNSATSGLFLALKVLHDNDDYEFVGFIKKYQNVITTPFTFVSTVNVIEQVGLVPLFVDIDPDTHNMDMNEVNNLLETRDDIYGILSVHYGGLSCDFSLINKYIEMYGIRVIEDSAHIFPIDKVYGDVSVLSFYATKIITTGEGGMILTDDDFIVRELREISNHGMDTDTMKRYKDGISSYDIWECGYKFNMPDILAAIGISQLSNVNMFAKRRKSIARSYMEYLSKYSEIKLPKWDDDHLWHLFTIELDKRTELANYLKEAGIETSVHFRPVHMMSYYEQKYGYKPEDFPNAYNAYKKIMSLPIYPSLTEIQQNYIFTKIEEFFEGKN